MHSYAALFYLLAAVILAGAGLAVTRKNPMHAVLFLVTSLLASAALYMLLGAPLPAVLQVVVYAGAIMVLFIFVIMMLQGPVLEGERHLLRRWLWPLVALPPAAVAVLVIGWLRGRGTIGLGGAPAADFGTAEQVAGLLLGRYLLAFELISIVLLVAIIGALAVGKRERKLPWK